MDFKHTSPTNMKESCPRKVNADWREAAGRDKIFFASDQGTNYLNS